MGVTERWATALPKKNKNVVLRTWEQLKKKPEKRHGKKDQYLLTGEGRN